MSIRTGMKMEKFGMCEAALWLVCESAVMVI
jgi:hypothetical protein